MRFISLTACLSLAITSATAAVIDARALTCNAANVDFIKQRVAHSVYLCDFYLS